MDAKVSAFVTCVEAIIYLPLYNLQDCALKTEKQAQDTAPVSNVSNKRFIRT